MPLTKGTLDNPNAGRIRRIADLARAKTRRKTGRMLVEAPQAVREAITFRPDLVEDLYVEIDEDGNTVSARAAAIVADVLGRETRGEGTGQDRIYVHYVTERVMAAISTDAQGIAATAQTGDLGGDLDAWTLPTQTGDGGRRPLVAAFWQVRDPGNAGTVIRTADAAGADAVVFVDECVDPLGPKVVRSTAGSLYHIPVLRASVDGFLDWNARNGLHVVAADVRGTEAMRPTSLADLIRRGDASAAAPAWASDGAGASVLFGNEARGLDDDVLERCDGIVSIPIYGRAESLNLATSASVLLYSLAMSSHVRTM
ncbi:RNA methyltransferase [Bifidobacterium sp. 82T24]|uniref:TrmH family RNA methyltransferase n=1 Tax=Bifidobacterium pluvialisilvae TaxID=2834436 RepID=UPI001C59FAAC|nr:RNA methyltransferase [Bifidobacterium pluvialisilvae]MBW3087227.1 RNA methyltransferase [Bifidobacterium pluvialisilvae]